MKHGITAQKSLHHRVLVSMGGNAYYTDVDIISKGEKIPYSQL